ncbi:hypothetical protein Hdeb2414_s0006g00200541 [Helianthus debilis subsp. tardiflorus]
MFSDQTRDYKTKPNIYKVNQRALGFPFWFLCWLRRRRRAPAANSGSHGDLHSV